MKAEFALAIQLDSTLPYLQFKLDATTSILIFNNNDNYNDEDSEQ
ncbi:hypothetical protein [Mongoliibacter sp.]|nr:hypothetical protein [Mongoliibacter sp.]